MTWAYCVDEESTSWEIADSKDAAILEGHKNYPNQSFLVFEVEPRSGHYYLPDAEDVLESATRQLLDNDWCACDVPIDTTEAAKTELDFFLKQWGQKHLNGAVVYLPVDEVRETIELNDPRRTVRFDLTDHIRKQSIWSQNTFGPGARSAMTVAHIRKELIEIEADPTDITEWIDVILLAIDGACRAGASPEQICQTLTAKQAKNESRVWPDWRTAVPSGPIEHVREEPRRGASCDPTIQLVQQIEEENEDNDCRGCFYNETPHLDGDIGNGKECPSWSACWAPSAAGLRPQTQEEWGAPQT